MKKLIIILILIAVVLAILNIMKRGSFNGASGGGQITQPPANLPIEQAEAESESFHRSPTPPPTQ